MMQRTNRLGWGAGLMFMFFGIIGMQFFAKPVSRMFANQDKWAQTEGTITSGEVISFRSSGQNMYRASLTYNYTVEGKEFHSDAIHSGTSSTSFKYFPQRKIDKHPAGSKVPVFYNPDQPSEALLEPGLGILKYVLYGIPGIFILIGFVVFLKRAIKPLVAVLILSKTKL